MQRILRKKNIEYKIARHNHKIVLAETELRIDYEEVSRKACFILQIIAS